MSHITSFSSWPGLTRPSSPSRHGLCFNDLSRFRHGDGRVEPGRAGRLERIAVFAKADGSAAEILVGELAFEGAARRASRLTYAAGWLGNPGRFALAPRHRPLRSRSIASAPHLLPLPFADWSPDGWEQTLLAAAYRSVIRIVFKAL